MEEKNNELIDNSTDINTETSDNNDDISNNDIELKTEAQIATDPVASDVMTDVKESVGISDDIPDFDEILKKKEMIANKKRIKKNKAIKSVSNIIDIITFLRDILICLFIAVIVATFLIKPIKVNGSSMVPTLENNDLGFSNIIGYTLNGVNRFDIVVVYSDELNEFIVKRVIGMPNETIAYEENTLYINNVPMEETFFDEEYRSETMMLLNEYFTRDFSEVTLGADEYFVMGDNRPYSTDSRTLGKINKSDIKSKGIFVLFPFNRFGSVK